MGGVGLLGVAVLLIEDGGLVLFSLGILALIVMLGGWYVHVFFSTRRRRADFFSGLPDRTLRAAHEDVRLGQDPRT
jgi:hypothetical protein